MSLDCGRVALLDGNRPAGKQFRRGGLFRGFHDNKGGERCSDGAAAKGRVSPEGGLALKGYDGGRIRATTCNGFHDRSVKAGRRFDRLQGQFEGNQPRSPAFTCRANRRSLLISVSASSWSSAGRLQRVNSAASHLRSSGLAIETLLHTRQAASQQRFDRRGGPLLLGGEFIARLALLIG
jgi:hypothetical protein